MIELKPCKYCGGAGKYHGSYFEDDVCEYVSCTRCNASTPLMYKKGESIEWWNRRPSPWHTGTPSENGKYLVQYKTGFMEFLSYRDGKWFAKETVETMWGEMLKTKREDVTDLVIAWQRIEPFEEYECPHYQGVCGLDESIICYSKSNKNCDVLKATDTDNKKKYSSGYPYPSETATSYSKTMESKR